MAAFKVDRLRWVEMFSRIAILLLICLTTVSCAPVSRPSLNTPMSFEVAVKLLAYDLFAQINNQQFITEKYNKVIVITDAVVSADTGDEIELSKHIGELLAQTAKENFQKFSVIEMTPQNLEKANYVVIGAMKLEQFGNSQTKLPHLFLSVVEMKTSRIRAHSEVWISNQNMELKPTPLYSDNPMYIKDKRFEALIAIAKAASGTAASKEYFETLDTTALLSEAGGAYDSGDYTLALGLFAKVAERDDGLVMKTFSGLYQCFLKLNRINEAEEAFAKLAELGIRSGNLSVKFLFQVNDTNFFGEPQELVEYDIWLRQIAKKIVESGACVDISGHASRSGSADYNKQLSHRRAMEIRNRLQAEASGIVEKTSAVGRGFEENIVGSGTNDIRDAIDRRVEFKLIECAASR